MAFEFLQGWRLHNLFQHQSCSLGKLFLMFEWNLLCFSVCPLSLVLFIAEAFALTWCLRLASEPGFVTVITRPVQLYCAECKGNSSP